MLLHKTVREVPVGSIIQVVTTDPSTLRDITKFCHFLGHELLRHEERAKDYVFYIKKAEP